MRRPFSLTTWIAFADFFAAIAVISIVLFARGRRDKPCPNCPECPLCQDCPKTDNLDVPPEIKALARKIHHALNAEHISAKLDERSYAIILPDTFLFQFDQRVIDDASRAQKIAAVLRSVGSEWHSKFVLMIRGHTDAYGGWQYNHSLAHDRAQALEQALADSGIRAPTFQVAIQGVGESEPKVNNCRGQSKNAYECEALLPQKDLAPNRRIELRFGIFTGGNAPSSPSH